MKRSQITWPKEQLSIIYRFNDILSLLQVLKHTYNNKYDYDINSIMYLIDGTLILIMIYNGLSELWYTIQSFFRIYDFKMSSRMKLATNKNIYV